MVQNLSLMAKLNNPGDETEMKKRELDGDGGVGVGGREKRRGFEAIHCE